MRCKKCGKKLREKEKFCTICGYYNSGNNEKDEGIEFRNSKDGLVLDDFEPNLLDESTYENNEEYDDLEEFDLKADSSGTKENEFFYKDEKYLEAYIGEDYKLIKKSPFNIYAFLLNWSYVLYRKMYVVGILGMVITGIVVLQKPKFLIAYILITMVIIGLAFNKVYIFLSKLKVEFMIKKLKDTDSFTIENICEKRGGVKVVPALIIYLIFLIIIFFSMFNVYYNKNNNTTIWTENSENRATCNSLVRSAYKSIEENPVTGTLSEGLCSIKLKGDNKEYDVYLKITNADKIIYLHYKTKERNLVYDKNTEDIQELAAKKVNGNITKEEEKDLNAKRKIEEDYYNKAKKSKEEEKLIEEKKDRSERKNYTFTKDEIIR